jgi:hypothetical protein
MKKGKQILCPHGRYQRHPPSTGYRSKKQDRQPLDVEALASELQVLTLTLK